MILVDGYSLKLTSSSSSSSQGTEILNALMGHPFVLSSSHAFRDIPERNFTSSEESASERSMQPKCVYLFQREYATVDPEMVDFIGTDEATTCVGLAIRNRHSGMTSVAHMDSPGVVEIGLMQMLSLVVNDGPEDELDVHLIGGFEDVSVSDSNQDSRTETHGKRVGHSLPLCAKIVELLWKRHEKFHVQTMFVLGHNTRRDAEANAYPIFNGFVSAIARPSALLCSTMVKAEKAIVLALFCFLLVSTWVPVSNCAKKPVTVARKEDIPFIKCQVCEKLASQLHDQVQREQAKISPKKISEYEIIEIAENVCNLKKAEADWILKIDIVEKGDKLELVEQDTEGICNSECKTIEKACQEIMGYSDTDVAEYLYKRKPQIDSLVDFVCKDLTGACNKNPPPVPADRTPGEAFMPKPAKEAEMEKILRSMEGMPGAPSMKMYSRDDLMNMKNFGEEDDNDDDDEDDDGDAHFSSKLGKLWRDKERKEEDWKQKLAKNIKTTGETLKKHANNVSNRVRQWWRGMKKANPKKRAKSSNSEL